ncbi:hypothetical protein ACGIF2_07725 [Cellulomonas sp. P22]|uniref:hypothetical protein n=1 Tax=Cellulomonas sp. P22 TaxID=3373189 RepID=UPI0037B40650
MNVNHPQDPPAPTSPGPGPGPEPAARREPRVVVVPPRRAVVGDDSPLVPGRSADDSDTGWGERTDSNDDRLLRDVPPHWA